MATAVIEQPQQQNPLESQALTLSQSAKQLVVTNDQQYIVACEHAKGLKDLEDKITDWFEPLTQSAHSAWKKLTGRRADTIAPIKEARAHVNRQIVGWDEKKEAERQKVEALRREQLQKEEDDTRLNEAAQLEREGSPELAQQVLDSPSLAPPVIEPKSLPKVSGISFREGWDFEIVDASKLPREYLMPDEKAIKAWVGAKGLMANIAGVRVFPKKTVAARTK